MESGITQQRTIKRMSENQKIPKHWQIKKLGEVCFTTSGGTPSRGNKKYYEGNIPWVKSGELNKGLIVDTEEKISEEAIRNSSAKIFPKGTLLIALYGATIGKLAFLGVDAATNQAVCGIFKNEKIDSNYLYYYLFSKKPSLVKQGIGGAQPNISQGILKNLELPIPPLPEQQLIVSKIEELLSDLENGKQQLLIAQQQLKVYRQSLLKWAFEGKLTNKKEEWNFKPFKECLKFSQGIQVDVNLQSEDNNSGKVRFLRIIDFTQGKDAPRYIINPGERYIVAKEDIALVRYGATTGFVCTGLEGAIANNLFKVTPADSILNKYLFYFLISSKFQDIISQSVKGAAMPAISFGLINDVILPIPSVSEQQLIVDELESKLTVCDKIEETISLSLQQAETLKQSILKKAFEGKLV